MFGVLFEVIEIDYSNMTQLCQWVWLVESYGKIPVYIVGCSDNNPLWKIMAETILIIVLLSNL